MLQIFLLVFLAISPYYVQGHGMVLSPVNRASRWRYNTSAPINYDDNALFCGGRDVQWGQNGGQCGLCGDNYADPTPRTYELGGKYGEGVVVAKYAEGSVILVEVQITANHLGFFRFNLCNLDEFKEESVECFRAGELRIADGGDRYVIGSAVKKYKVELQLPDDVRCSRCVLQWTWTTANSWGLCENGQQQMGCGPQETFRTCSDISIE